MGSAPTTRIIRPEADPTGLDRTSSVPTYEAWVSPEKSGWETRTTRAERSPTVIGSALIAVVNDVVWLSLTNRHFQRRQHELGPQMRLHRPADNPAAERIEHHSEIQEPG